MEYRYALLLSHTITFLFTSIMSDLHSILTDPLQPLESTLSVLFNSGDAGDTFQREFFQHLNIEDAWNLRMANSRLNQIVKGAPLWQVLDSSGNLVYTRNRPANHDVPPVHNSTLRWLGVRCGGKRFPGLVRCQTRCDTDLQVKLCTRIPAPLDRYPRRDFQCCILVCVLCVDNAANQKRPLENIAISQTHQRPLCQRCQLYEARRHPLGYSSCVCSSSSPDCWVCYSCRHEVLKQVYSRKSRRMQSLSKLHRDRQGRKIVDPNRPPASKPLCPGCARSFTIGKSRDPEVSLVTYCMSCDGVVVKPSLGPDFQPTGLVPVQATKASARIAAKYAAMPPLDFTPIIIPSRR